MAFLPYCSLPELESCVTAWGFMEMIHSRSYSYIIKNIYSNPSEVFDTIINDEMILQRATSVTEAYNEFINNAHQYDNGSMWKFANEGVKLGVDERKELKRKLYRAIMNVNILEGVRFYVSFACSFAFGELKLMEGSAKIISLIARDEASHLNITQKILTKWKQGDDPEMIQIAEEEEDWAINMFKLAGDQEMSWATYLFKDGSIIGLNDKILCSYAQWIINLRMKPLGFKPIYDVPFKANPLPWTEHWLNSKSVQEAPQETEKESYLVGAIKQDIDSDTFSGFKL
jgi:ribonucleoside-diphosphate reductase beta chain